MKLTDADRAAISATLKISEPWDAGCAIEGDVVARLYLAGKRAGREDMRERAAKVCEELHSWQAINNQEHGREWHDAADAAAAEVRAQDVAETWRAMYDAAIAEMEGK